MKSLLDIILINCHFYAISSVYVCFLINSCTTCDWVYRLFENNAIHITLKHVHTGIAFLKFYSIFRFGQVPVCTGFLLLEGNKHR